MIAIATLLAGSVLAHYPHMSTDEYSTPEDAFRIVDVNKSIVVYDHVTCEAAQLWMRFRLEQPGDLFVQLGVPVLDRLEGYRPSLAILAPGLPEIDVPFDVPDGLGGLVLDSLDVTSPADFYEPFTDTESWVVTEVTQALPAGDGYVVAFDPEHQTGKLWAAVGTLEDFSTPPDVTFEQIWSFHEKEGYEPDPVPVEETCVQAEPDDSGADTDGDPDPGDEPDPDGGTDGDTDGDGGSAETFIAEGACSVTPDRSGPLAMLGWLLLTGLRRRSATA